MTVDKHQMVSKDGANMEPTMTNDSVKAGEDAILAMGYEHQMRRSMTTFQLMATTFNTTGSWLGLLGAFSAGAIVGGPVIRNAC